MANYQHEPSFCVEWIVFDWVELVWVVVYVCNQLNFAKEGGNNLTRGHDFEEIPFGVTRPTSVCATMVLVKMITLTSM